MAEPINFNKARKARAKTDAEAKAAENRVRFGRTKAEKELERALQDKARLQQDQGKRER
jgi:hypothetical protein